MKYDALIQDIRRVALKCGIKPPHWRPLRKALDDEGVRAPKGGVWSDDISVKRFCEKHRVFDAEPSGATIAENGTTRPEPLQPDDVKTHESETSQTDLEFDQPDNGMTGQGERGHTREGRTTEEQGESYQSPETGNTDLTNTEPHEAPVPVASMTDESESGDTDLETTVVAIVRRELHKLLNEVELVPAQKSGRGGGSVMVKKAFSIPKDVWDQVEALGGIKSNHVTAALRIYLNMRQEPKKDGPSE